MSDTASSPIGGKFATSRRGGIAEDTAFILAQGEKGVPATAIAKMTGRAVVDVQAVLRVSPRRPAIVEPTAQERREALAAKIVRARQENARPMPFEISQAYQRLARSYGIPFEDLMFSSKRANNVQVARNEAYHMAYRSGHYPSTRIAAWFGLLDHTSVLTGIRNHQARIDANRKLAA